MDKIIALKEECMIGRYSERVGEAVANIQPGPMAAPAEAAKGVHRNFGLLRRGADDVEAAIAEQKFDIRPAGLALAALDDEGEFDPANRREQPNRRAADRARETL